MVLARGDRRLLKVLIDGYRQGLFFDAWDDCFRFEDWMSILESHGLSLHFLGPRPRDIDEVLPGTIDIGVRKDYLLREREMAYRGKTIAPRHGGCKQVLRNIPCGMSCLKTNGNCHDDETASRCTSFEQNSLERAALYTLVTWI